MNVDIDRLNRVVAAINAGNNPLDGPSVRWETLSESWKLRVWGLEFVRPSMDECTEALAEHLFMLARARVADAREALEHAEAQLRAAELAVSK